MAVKIKKHGNGELSAIVEFEKPGYTISEYLFNDCHADSDEGKAIYKLIEHAFNIESENKRLREAFKDAENDIETLEYKFPKWIKIEKPEDAPNHDCFVAFIEKQFSNGEDMDAANVGGSVGYLSHSRNPDLKYWSIIDCGEVITPYEVYALCVIPSPLTLIQE